MSRYQTYFYPTNTISSPYQYQYPYPYPYPYQYPYPYPYPYSYQYPYSNPYPIQWIGKINSSPTDTDEGTCQGPIDPKVPRGTCKDPTKECRGGLDNQYHCVTKF